MKLKLFLLWMGILLTAVACGSDAPAETPGEPTAGDDPVTVEMFYPVAVDAPIAEILQGYVDTFEAENPNVDVELVFSGGYGDVKTAIQTTVEGGGTPPALAVMLATDLYDLVNAGLITPLDGYIDDDAYLNDFYEPFWANSYFADQVWSVPFQRSVVLMYYNQDLLTEAGLEAPASWEELGQATQALTVREGEEVSRWGILWPSGWPYWTFQPLAIGSGQNLIGESDTAVFFDDPDVVEAVQFYNDLSETYEGTPAGVQAVWGTAPTDFASEQTAMIVHSSGSLPGILEQAEFEVGVMAVPGQETGTYATVVGGGNLYIMDGVSEAQKDAAWRFIQFLTESERLADFSIQSGYVAARQSTAESDAMQTYFTDVPQARAALDVLEYAGAEFTVQNLGEVRSIFHDYLQQAFNDELTADAAMTAAQEEADEALEPFRE